MKTSQPFCASTSTVSLAIDPYAGLPTAVFAIAYDGFASNERVSLWYNRPDGDAVGLGEVRADAQGRLNHSIPATMLPIDRFTLVAYGQCSRVTAVGVLEVIGK